MASLSNIFYEFRIFVDITLYPDTNGRLKLIYDTFSNIKSEKKGGIPIFWGNNEYNIGHRDEEDHLYYCDLPANKTKKLDHKIYCCMLEVNKDEPVDKKLVPFTISGLNMDNILVHTQIVQPKDYNNAPLHVYMENISDEDIALDFGIAYARVYPPDISKTPRIVIVDDKNDLYFDVIYNSKTTIYYNPANAESFKRLVKKNEIRKLEKSGHKFYNGLPKW